MAKDKKKGSGSSAKAPARERSGAAKSRATAGSALGKAIVQGPSKKRPKAGPGPRWSNHKRRAVWFQSRASWPRREASVETLLREQQRVSKSLPPTPGQALWEMAGPTNIGGRCTCLAANPADANQILIGSAGGGVWRSDDGGRTWAVSWNQDDVLTIGSLALDPSDARVVYCGTGEANLSADSYPGVGLFRSDDRGITWVLIADSSKTGLPRRMGAVAVDPFDSKHILVGGIGYSDDAPGGLYETADRGATWARLSFISAKNYWCHAVVFHPANRGTIFATVSENGAKNGIWRTTDGGGNWSQLTSGMPSPSLIKRTSLAIAPSDPKIIWAQASDRADGVLGVFRSGDGGNIWKDASAGAFTDEGQMTYGNSIAVHPADPKVVICGGVDLHRTDDGGKTWGRITRWDAARGKDADYAHADHHCLLMPASTPGLIYDANDGGLDVSTDSGDHWENRSNGLPVTMFYDLDVAQSDIREYGGGAQDNGTLITVTGNSNDHWELLGGDGGWIVIDPADAAHIYASYQFMGLYRWRAGQPPKRVSPPETPEAKKQIWMAYVMFDPNDSRTLFVGTQRVWRTKNDAQSWQAVSGILDQSPITAIEIAPADSKRVYVGTENGGFFASADGGKTWSGNLAGATLPGKTITRIETAPRDAKFVLLTVANFGHSHVFQSRDGGISWSDADGGRLPDVPHHAILIRPDAEQEVYVANDAGVFMSPDLGNSWLSLKRNMPNVMVVDLVYHLGEKTLFAATYGRSTWKLKLS